MRQSGETAVDGDRTRLELATALEQLRVAQSELATRVRELEDARQRSASLFALAPVAYVVTDAKGVVQEMNEAAAELLNVRAGFVHGKPIAVFAADRREFYAYIRDVLDAGFLVTELVLVPRDGRRIHVSISGRSVPRPSGEPEIFWAITDLEWRVSAETELRLLAAELEARVEQRTAELEREQALLAAVVDQMPAGLIIAEAPSGRLLRVNARAAGIVRGELPMVGGVEDYTFYRGFRTDGTELEPGDWPLARALTTGEIVAGELVQIERGDGTLGWVESSATPVVDADGRIAAAVVVFADVTDRERTERAQREFVTNAAHELLTPLAAITSAVEVLQGGAKEDPVQRDRFLAHAERETARLGRLARALLVLARAQMGVEAPRGEVIELAPLLEEVASGLNPAPGVTVSVDCPPEVALVSNRELAGQAFANLGGNAAKFTQTGSILFRARMRGDARVVVEVADTGPGLSEEEVAVVFGRFYRARESREAAEGFGLGLAVARQAVEALGGEIELRSKVGEGTVVAVTLPGAQQVRR